MLEFGNNLLVYLVIRIMNIIDVITTLSKY